VLDSQALSQKWSDLQKTFSEGLESFEKKLEELKSVKNNSHVELVVYERYQGKLDDLKSWVYLVSKAELSESDLSGIVYKFESHLDYLLNFSSEILDDEDDDVPYCGNQAIAIAC
jgi:hypothetical protein